MSEVNAIQPATDEELLKFWDILGNLVSGNWKRMPDSMEDLLPKVRVRLDLAEQALRAAGPKYAVGSKVKQNGYPEVFTVWSEPVSHVVVARPDGELVRMPVCQLTPAEVPE
jgi:hypothetical protein